MNQLTCEICGGTNIVKDGGVFVCQDCGIKYSIDEIKKMMTGNGDAPGRTVVIDNTQELQNLIELARRARDDNNSVNAQKYYGEVLLKDPNSWEANFYNTYFQSMNCKIAEIILAANRIKDSLETVFNMMNKSIADEVEKKREVNEISERLISISNMLFNANKSFYDDDVSDRIKDRFVQQYANTGSATRDLLYVAGNKIVEIFGEEYGAIAANLWKEGVIQHNILNGVFTDKEFNANIIASFNDKIKKYDELYLAPVTNMKQDGGCYLTTACVYRKNLPDDCDELMTLRSFRDGYLVNTINGKKEIKEYYETAPQIIEEINKRSSANEIYDNIYDDVIAPCVKLIKEGRNEEAHIKYKAMVSSLKEQYLN